MVWSEYAPRLPADAQPVVEPADRAELHFADRDDHVTVRITDAFDWMTEVSE